MTRQRTTTTQTQTQTSSEFASSATTDGVTFSKGNMMVHGNYQTPTEVKRWRSSNGLSVYTAVVWQDPDTGERRTSCNCQGWAIKRGDKPRDCKHTKHLKGIKTCRDEVVDEFEIRTVEAASAAEIPGYDTRNFRGLDLD